MLWGNTDNGYWSCTATDLANNARAAPEDSIATAVTASLAAGLLFPHELLFLMSAMGVGGEFGSIVYNSEVYLFSWRNPLPLPGFSL